MGTQRDSALVGGRKSDDVEDASVVADETLAKCGEDGGNRQNAMLGRDARKAR